LLNDHNDPEIISAKNVEIKNWKDFNAYEEVENQGQPSFNNMGHNK